MAVKSLLATLYQWVSYLVIYDLWSLLSVLQVFGYPFSRVSAFSPPTMHHTSSLTLAVTAGKWCITHRVYHLQLQRENGRTYLQFHASQRHAVRSPLSSPIHSSMRRRTTSATATRASHTSVERNHGNMADSGGCCAGGHLGARILQSLRSKAIKLLLFHLYEFSEWHPFSSNLTYTLTDINNTHVCPLPTMDDEIKYHKTVRGSQERSSMRRSTSEYWATM